ncbi:MAG: arginine--tRNA ligase [Chlorobi bacterium]|nr:arginine--tRNA ligase [Chlorobiota bacterium]
MKSYIEPLLRNALAQISAPDDTEIILERPKQADHGDLSTSVALGLARHLKKAPRLIAEELVAALAVDKSDVSGVEIAGPGFINFRFTPAFFQGRLNAVQQKAEEYGRTNNEDGIKTNVEYVSANPTGPLHPGHGRNAALGDTIANILNWVGHDVTREYYFNNAGNQMRNLAKSIHARYLELLGHDVEFPEDGYRGEYIYEIARDVIENEGEKYVEVTDENIDAMRGFGEQWNFALIKKTMEALGIHHDTFFNETTLYEEGKIEQTITRLAEVGRTYNKDGALYLKLEDLGRDDRVIVKSSGEPTYRLPDIAYHMEKLERGFEKIIDVLGADHIDAVPDVTAAVGMLGGEASNIVPVIHQMVSFVEGGEQVKFSKRSGKAITLDELIEDFGADVVRFFFIMRGANTHLEFDLDLAREQSDKNPVFYLQYAHARISGVLRHAESEGIALNMGASLEPLQADEEITLIKQILEFPEALERAARDLEPQIIAEYLRELAVAFHKFYHEHRIVGANTDAERDARLRLLAASKTTFANGLMVLGVDVPERM